MWHLKNILIYVSALVIAAILARYLEQPDPRDPEIVKEAEAINSTDGKAMREGDTLILKIDDGDPQIWKNRAYCADSHDLCLFYHFIAYFKNQPGFMIEEWNGGSIEYYWANAKTGKLVTFPFFPHFSPSGKIAALVESTPQQGLTRVEIWERQEDGFVLVSDTRFADYAPFGFFKWISDSEFCLSPAFDQNKEGERVPLRGAVSGAMVPIFFQRGINWRKAEEGSEKCR